MKFEINIFPIPLANIIFTIEIVLFSPNLCHYLIEFIVDKRLDEWVGEDHFLKPPQINQLKRQGRLPSDLSIPTTDLNSLSLTDNVTEHAILHHHILRRQRHSRSDRSPFSSSPWSPTHPEANPDPEYAKLEREHEEATRVKNIQQVIIGKYEIQAWYFSPYPAEFAKDVDRLYVCEKCLKYMKEETLYADHYHHHCQYNGPPGKCIYLHNGLAVFELDGSIAKLFCQNLCLLAKLFLDHKTLYYDVTPFFFYVLCEVDGQGVHPVGYFSKEKASLDDYNLACIMVLPPYQKKGYGRFLIQLSYELTRREGKRGSPEKPLSDLGRLSYFSFWAFELLIKLKAYATRSIIPSLEQLSRETGFKLDDITDTLSELGLMRHYRGQKVLNLAPRAIDNLFKEYEGRRFTLLDPTSLVWP